VRLLKLTVLATAFGLFVSAEASATITVSLVQIGGTYVAPGVSGDTLTLNMNVSGTAGDTLGFIGTSILYDPVHLSLNGAVPGAGTTEFSFAFLPLAPGLLSPIAKSIDHNPNPFGVPAGLAGVQGWEASAGAGSQITFLGSTSFTLGTINFVLNSATTDVIPTFCGTPACSQSIPTTGDTAFDLFGPIPVNFNSFTVEIPEPATAGLVMLGLLGLAIGGRRQK
jgi:hypothetical protein